MRKKVLKLVVAFEETTDAIEAEEYFGENNIEGRMIPVSYTHLDVYKRQQLYILQG